MSKLRTSIDAFLKSEGLHARLDHLTAMEINSVRPLLPHALDQMLRIQNVHMPCVKHLLCTLKLFSINRMNFISADREDGIVSTYRNLTVEYSSNKSSYSTLECKYMCI